MPGSRCVFVCESEERFLHRAGCTLAYRLFKRDLWHDWVGSHCINNHVSQSQTVEASLEWLYMDASCTAGVVDRGWKAWYELEQKWNQQTKSSDLNVSHKDVGSNTNITREGKNSYKYRTSGTFLHHKTNFFPTARWLTRDSSWWVNIRFCIIQCGISTAVVLGRRSGDKSQPRHKSPPPPTEPSLPWTAPFTLIVIQIREGSVV